MAASIILAQLVAPVNGAYLTHPYLINSFRFACSDQPRAKSGRRLLVTIRSHPLPGSGRNGYAFVINLSVAVGEPFRLIPRAGTQSIQRHVKRAPRAFEPPRRWEHCSSIGWGCPLTPSPSVHPYTHCPVLSCPWIAVDRPSNDEPATLALDSITVDPLTCTSLLDWLPVPGCLSWTARIYATNPSWQKSNR